MKIKDILPKDKEYIEEGLAQSISALSIAALLSLAPDSVEKGKDVNSIKAAISAPKEISKAKSKPFYKIGVSYSRKGKTYKPKYDPDYEATGKASWYGPGFDGKLTANADVFDTSELTAAHPTLPLFSRVWVTNLENGKKVLVTVNDRGPFHDNRLIDLSNAAAQSLGFIDKGVADVKVEYDQQETEKYLKDIGLYSQYKKAIEKLKNKS